jgi:hypothetical protein
VLAYAFPGAAAEWTWAWDAKGATELPGWAPWSYPAGTQMTQGPGPKNSLAISCTGSAFALNRPVRLSRSGGYTIAFGLRAHVPGLPDPASSQAFLDVQDADHGRLRLVWTPPRDQQFSDGALCLLARAGVVAQVRLLRTDDGFHTYWLRGETDAFEIWVDSLDAAPAIAYRGPARAARGDPGLAFGDDNGSVGPSTFDIAWLRLSEATALAPSGGLDGPAVPAPPDDGRLAWKPWALAQDFVIGAWGVFNRRNGLGTPAQVRLYREAGLNVMIAGDHGKEGEAVELGRAEGLAVLVPGQWGGGSDAAFEEWNELANSYPDVGYQLWDEPMEGQFALLAQRVKRLNGQDPSRMVWTNLLPQNSWGQSYIGKVDTYLSLVQPPVVSYDLYPTLSDGTDHPEVYANMEAVRTAASEHEIPWWGFALCVKCLDYREPSETDLRWQAYSLVTYGAKGLWYFTWNGGWGNPGLVSEAGEPTHLYRYARDLNAELHSMGPTLARLRSTQAGHVGRVTPFATMFSPNELVTSAKAESALVGLFVDPEGTEYVMVTNKLHGPDVAAGKTQAIELTLSGAITKVGRVGSSTAEPEWGFDAQTHTLRLAARAGTGYLFRLGD